MNITPLILFATVLLIGNAEGFWGRRRRSVQQRPRGPPRRGPPPQRGGPPPQGCPLGPPPPGYQPGVPPPPRGPPPPGYRAAGPPRGARGPRPAGGRPVRPRRRGDEELSDEEQLKELLFAIKNKDFDTADSKEILKQISDKLQE